MASPSCCRSFFSFSFAYISCLRKLIRLYVYYNSDFWVLDDIAAGLPLGRNISNKGQVVIGVLVGNITPITGAGGFG